MTKLAFMGAGNIAQAIIGGLIEGGFNPINIWAADPTLTQLDKLKSRQINTTTDNLVAVAKADVIIISVKPDVVESLAREVSALASGKLFISVAAGVTTRSLVSWLGCPTIIRCMPNTPALLQKGMTGLFATKSVTAENRKVGESILAAVGETRWFEKESDLDAVTAISGSGPAYFFYVIEVMQSAAEQLGLSREEARQLVLQTAVGACEMAAMSTEPAAELRRRVTSPGGTTEAAINKLIDGGLESLFLNAVLAAKNRSEELGD
jgi:pyrroline-5-carboxylate reductase